VFPQKSDWTLLKEDIQERKNIFLEEVIQLLP
jgi:hypothetical protein